jgi:hypothetical protein
MVVFPTKGGLKWANSTPYKGIRRLEEPASKASKCVFLGGYFLQINMMARYDPMQARRGGNTMAEQEIIDVAEQKRLNEAREAGIPWKKWGPYLSERQWGTVREDYSPAR